MNKRKQQIVFIFLFCSGIAFFVSCSQKSNSFIAKGFHNTTARYNAYFLCKERMLEVEAQLRDNHVDDYNQVLHLYPTVDSNFTQSMDEDFKFINERAILIPAKHKNSKWVDDAYILMGKVKMYRVKLDSAEKFFRYINNTFKNKKAKQEAQLYLIQTFLLKNQLRYARMAEDLVTKSKAIKRNELLYHKTLADYYRTIENYDKMLPHVEAAIPFEHRKDERARLYYILGQLYRRQQQNEDAFTYFKKAQKRNPPYILLFNAKLSAMAVAPFNNEKEKKYVQKQLKRLIKEPNNKEYLDRIYYEMATYFKKHGMVDSTIANVEKSLRASDGNQLQKGYSYLMNAETYYEEVDYLSRSRKEQRSVSYVNSKLYYDSTISSVDSTFKNYEEILVRQEILERFVEQVIIVEKEDSLLRWANMDKDKLDALIEQLAIAEEARLIAEEEARRENIRNERAIAAAAAQNASSGGIYDPNASTTFNFYDPASIENAKLAFKAKWGDRPLEDNWRRSNKEASFEEILTDPDTTTLAGADTTTAPVEEDLDAPIEIHVDRQTYYTDIPYTDEQKKEANIKIEHGLYILGKIYNNELFEKEYAIVEFEKHVDRYTSSVNRAEVLYTLAVLCQKSTTCDTEKYVRLLHDEFPNSKYTKLIDNPNYVADYQQKNIEARKKYEEAYDFYQSGQYIACNNSLRELKQLYPINDIPDKIQFLTVLMYAKRDRMFAYYKGLKDFLIEYKTSEIIPYAKRLIAEYEAKNGSTKTVASTTFEYDSLATYYVIAIYDRDSLFSRTSIDDFNTEFFETFYKQKQLETKRMELNQQYFIFTFKQFNQEKGAVTCVQKMKDFASFKELKSNFSYYLISKNNYQLLISTENTNGYREFFGKYYP